MINFFEGYLKQTSPDMTTATRTKNLPLSSDPPTLNNFQVSEPKDPAPSRSPKQLLAQIKTLRRQKIEAMIQDLSQTRLHLQSMLSYLHQIEEAEAEIYAKGERQSLRVK